MKSIRHFFLQMFRIMPGTLMIQDGGLNSVLGLQFRGVAMLFLVSNGYYFEPLNLSFTVEC